MKLLKESKEELPSDFITSFVSNWWDEVGNLKASIDAVSKTFKETTEVETVLQDLMDTYLISIGKFETLLHKKHDIEIPITSPEKNKNTDKLKEDINVEVQHVDVNLEVATPDEDTSRTACMADDDDKIKPVILDSTREEPEAFEYFVDFDEPDLSTEKVTDRDLYN